MKQMHQLIVPPPFFVFPCSDLLINEIEAHLVVSSAGPENGGDESLQHFLISKRKRKRKVQKTKKTIK
jgi:hypothetical protein